MRLSNLMLIILMLATMMGIARDDVGRVAVIVFLTGLGTVVTLLVAIMGLFQTLGALAEAGDSLTRLVAVAASAAILVVGSSITLGLMFAGARLVQWSIP